MLYHPVSKTEVLFRTASPHQKSSAFSSPGKHRIPANALSPIRREQTAASISSRGVVRHFFRAPCNASQQSELLPAELEASFAHTAIHQRLYARLDSVASAIFTDQRTEKAGESEKQLPGFVVLGFSPDLTPAEYEKILSAAESRHDRTHRKSRLLGNDFPDFDPSIRAVGALYIQGNGPFAGLRIAVNGAGFVGSGPVAEIPAPLLDLSS